jgi:hypothetical protein
MYNHKKYIGSFISFYILHTYISDKYPNIIRYKGDKKETLHSDCIFGPKNINIKYVDMFIKSIK